MKRWLSANYLTLLCQLVLCAGGIYAVLRIVPNFPALPWIREDNATSTTDYLLRQYLPGSNDSQISPSAILRQELLQLPPAQDILFVGDTQHLNTFPVRWLVAYFAFPRRIVNPLCNVPNEWKHPYDPAQVSAVIFFGKPPKVKIAAPPVQVLPGLKILRIGGDERWQSFCLP